ncbi:MAG: ATP-dependent sacrificial sulfur transferase LarE [Thermodesulfobacteriota bacterium]
MPPDIPAELRPRWQALLARLRALAPLAVAFSGGVDSSLLLAAARQALGPGVAAVICLGPFTPPWEAQRARALAAQLGAELIEVDAGELHDPAIAANDAQRCYHCKRLRLGRLRELAQGRGLRSVVEGSQLDDEGEDRPGKRAVRELGVHSPLAEAGLDKAAVRALSRALGLMTAEVPSSACLATRVPTGTALTAEALARIGRGEAALRAILPGQLRLRDHFPLARLELSIETLPLAAAEPRRAAILEALTPLGYRRVCLDLAGYGSGGGSAI